MARDNTDKEVGTAFILLPTFAFFAMLISTWLARLTPKIDMPLTIIGAAFFITGTYLLAQKPKKP